MPKVLQHRRANTSYLSTFTGAPGELFVNTTDWSLTVHDGSTPGGQPVGGGGGVTCLNAGSGIALSGQTGNVIVCATSSGASYCKADNNTIFAPATINSITDGKNTFAAGLGALCYLTSGCHNIALGCDTLKSITSGSYNIAIGRAALRCTAGGTANNIAIGAGAMQYSASAGNHNVAVGGLAMNQACGKYNVAVGYSVLRETGSCYGVSIGFGTLQKNTSGVSNIGIGRKSLYCTTSGCKNLAIGDFAGHKNTTGKYNIFQGVETGCAGTTSSYNVGIGWKALKCGTTTQCNIGIGTCAGGVGLTGSDNTFIGRCAGMCVAANSGARNVAIGSGAMYSRYNNANASDNIALGYRSLRCLRSGCSNIALGKCALGTTDNGSHNISLGFCAGFNNASGNNNIFIGANSSGLAANSTNTITFGDSTITTIRAQVTSITALSDYRDKSYIETLPVGLEFLRQVRPVKFTWKMRDGSKVGQKETGFIAQELKQVKDNSSIKEWLEDLVISNEDNSRHEAAPGKMFPLLVKAIQELADKNDELTARIVVLENK